jgi:ribose transport system substrate-binding protein
MADLGSIERPAATRRREQMIRLGTARALVAISVMAIVVGACTSGGGATPTPASQAPGSQAPGSGAPASPGAKDYTIGYSNAFGIGNGFREEQLCTAKAQALFSGQVASGTWTNEKEETYPQLQQIRDLIAKQPDAIIFNPNGPDVLNPALQEAHDAGIKTVALDAYVTDPNTLNISNDQVAYGYIGAKWLFEQLGGTGNVYYMRGLAGHPADNDRHQGVLKALGENPGIKLLPNNEGVATGWDPDTGTKLITDLINSGGYDDVDGIWTSGIDQQVVDAIKAAGKQFVPIVGADLKGFVEMLLNKNGGYDGLKGLAVYNPAAIGGAGLTLALKALNGEQIDSQTKTVKDSQGNDVQIQAIFLPEPESYDNTTDAGKAKLQEIDVDGLNNLWPVSWYINGWTDYTIDQMLACKGPGE